MTEKRKYLLVNLIFGFVIAALVVWARWDTEKLLSFQLCDATFVAGMLLIGLSGLKFARNGGTFDMMAYGIGSAVRVTMPWVAKERKDVDFAAYKERKREERKPARGEFTAGAIYMIISVLCYIVYSYQV